MGECDRQHSSNVIQILQQYYQHLLCFKSELLSAAFYIVIGSFMVFQDNGMLWVHAGSFLFWLAGCLEEWFSTRVSCILGSTQRLRWEQKINKLQLFMINVTFRLLMMQKSKASQVYLELISVGCSKKKKNIVLFV